MLPKVHGLPIDVGEQVRALFQTFKRRGKKRGIQKVSLLFLIPPSFFFLFFFCFQPYGIICLQEPLDSLQYF